MLYTKRSFTVPASSGRVAPENCTHGWLDARGNCMYCGQPSRAATVASFQRMREHRAAHVDRYAETSTPAQKYELGYERTFGSTATPRPDPIGPQTGE